MNTIDSNEDLMTDLPLDDATHQEARRRRQRLANLLRGRWRVVAILAVLLGSILALAGYFSQETLYASTGRIQLTQHLPEVMRSNQGYTTGEFLRTEMALLKSPRVIDLALKDEGWRQAAGKDADKAGAILSGIKIDPVKRTSLIDISFLHRDPVVARAGLRAVMAAHKKAFSDKYDSLDTAKLEILHARRNEVTTLLVNIRNQRNSLTKDLGGNDTLDLLYAQKFKEKQKVESVLNDVRLALAIAGAAEDTGESPFAAMTDEQLATLDQVMAGYATKKASLQYQIDVLRRQGKGDNHRQIKRRSEELLEIEDRLAQHGNLLRQGLVQPRTDATSGLAKASIEQLRVRERDIARQLETAKAELTDIGGKSQQVEIFNDKLVEAERDLRQVNQKIDGMSIGKIGEHIEVISSGAIGVPANGAKRIKLAAMGGVVGMGLSVALVMLWGTAFPRFRHIDDAELDLPNVLGSLPTLPQGIRNHEQGILVAHAVHHIRTLLQIGREGAPCVFSITSPATGSGKTSLTMALGLSFASAGSRTLMIDCDIVGGGLTRRMNATVQQRLGQMLLAKGLIDSHAIDEALKASQVSGKLIGEALVGLGYVSQSDMDVAIEEQKKTAIGLLEACTGEDFAACVAPTGVDGLDLLPIGSAMPQQAGTLSPAAIKRIIATARGSYDAILIDSGPILGSLEASMAAAESDGTIFVISRGERKTLVDKCLRHCKRINAKLIGVVFNHALTDDITRSSYGSIPVSQSRHPSHQVMTEPLDADTSARYGPLASAVVAYGTKTALRPPSSSTNGELH